MCTRIITYEMVSPTRFNVMKCNWIVLKAEAGYCKERHFTPRLSESLACCAITCCNNMSVMRSKDVCDQIYKRWNKREFSWVRPSCRLKCRSNVYLHRCGKNRSVMQYLATISKLYLCREKDWLFFFIYRIRHENVWGITFTEANLAREEKNSGLENCGKW